MSIFVDDKEIQTFNFPAGECHVRVSSPLPHTIVKAYLDRADDIMALLLTIDALRRFLPSVKIDLHIPYFPYGRQDRVCNQGESLSVKVMADLINNLKCDRVVIVDPHSEVTPALLNNCQVITQADIISQSNFKDELVKDNWVLISPDSGAEKKTLAVAKRIGIKDVFCSQKIRDTQTGKILATTFHHDVKGRKVLILDDICDGGKTFVELGKLLQQKEASVICLYITHGIFSKGLTPLRPYFNHIYCHHTRLSFSEQDSSFLTILPYVYR